MRPSLIFFVTNRFSGFKSLWIIPCLWIIFNLCIICFNVIRHVFNVKVFVLVSCKMSSKFGPNRSITNTDSPPIFLNKYGVGMPSFPSNIFNILYSCNNCGLLILFDSTFTEYSTLVLTFKHLYTWPNEPPPKRFPVNIL